MSVFLVSNCKLDSECYASSLSWSSGDPIAAVSCCCTDEHDRDSYQILFVNNEGNTIPNASISHDCEATVLEWQPGGRLLVIGWQDGMISCWQVDGRTRPLSTFSNSSQHNSEITIAKWNSVGKRLVTGEKRGVVCVWGVDARGTLSPLRNYKRKGAITSVAFCLLPGIRIENNRKSSDKVTFSPSFFFGTAQGALVYADDLGHCTDVQQLPASVDIMLFFEEKSRLVIITRSLLLTQYQVADDGRVSRIAQVKLSISGDINETGLKYVTWAAPGVLALATNEKFVRLLDLAADESYNLPLSAAGEITQKNDRVISVSFNRNERQLAIGTKMGIVLVWKFIGGMRDLSKTNMLVPGTQSQDWELIYKTQLPSSSPVPVLQLQWHPVQGNLGAVTEEGVVVLSEMNMQCGLSGELAVVQSGSHEVTVLVVGTQDSWVQHTSILIKGLSIGKSCFVVWSGKDARAFRVDFSTMRIESLEIFQTPGLAMAIADASQIVEESIFVADQSIIRVMNFMGVQKGSITFSETEGNVEHLHINGRMLTAITDKGTIGVYDVHTPKKPKALGSTGRFADNSNSLTVKLIRVNCDGSRVAIIADFADGSLKIKHPDTNIHVYDRNKGVVNKFDLLQFKRFPISASWDENDSRVLVCETVRIRTITSSGNKGGTQNQADVEVDAEIEIFSFFVTSENGIIMQDSFPRSKIHGAMLGVIVPRIYFRNSSNLLNDDNNDNNIIPSVRVLSKVMRDFIGMEDVDDVTRTALLDFSYHLTLGKLDEAYRAVKMIGNPTLWQNMAHMCVKTKRLDVAEVCLGNMGHARGAAAVRESKKEGSLEVCIGVLAIQLGLYDDAIKLFREANRYDLIANLYQSAGLWDKAIKTAASNDRIHLNRVHYLFAKHLESINDINGAIKHYTISETYRSEVPRMLHSLDRINELEDFVLSSNDPALLKWWAAYLESKGKYDTARKFYSKASDYLSMVRILCFRGDYNKAAEIIQEVGDRAAAYHFARQLENQGEYQEAINFYATAGCYNHCIRLAKAYGLDSELMRFALKSTLSLMLDCANYFESKGEYDKAVQLYHKGGDYPHALDLCFKISESDPSQSSIMFDMMNTIAQDLGSNSSPQTLARCAEFLVNHKQYDKAIDLYILAKRFIQAIDMCIQHKIPITEDLSLKLTPSNDIVSDANERKEILIELAKALKRQGSFILSSRKYTQAGDRIHAIKCLVKSGDTKAVIQFATISRNNEIYTLAANYLQQMNWRESAELMKAIITFYNKSKSYEKLAKFYDSCALVEIDEYGDYEKAVEALKEALKYLYKVENPSPNIQNSIDLIDKRIGLIEKFVFVKNNFMKDPLKMAGMCEELLLEPMIEDAIRSGDCYAILVEYYYSQNAFQNAYKYLLDMQDRRIAFNPYIDNDLVDKIFQANGQAKSTISISTSKPTHNDDDAVDEELEEALDEEIDDEDDMRSSSSKYRK